MSPSLQYQSSLSNFKTAASKGEQKSYFSAPFGNRHVLYACYFYIVTLAFLYDYSHHLLEMIRQVTHHYVMKAESNLDSVYEFSKNVQYYFTLARNVFRYRMFENIN